MFCENCGFQVGYQSQCPYCGYQHRSSNEPNKKKRDWLWGLLAVCYPLFGLIIYLVWRNERPNAARSGMIGMIIGVIMYVMIYILYILLLTGLFGQINEQWMSVNYS